MTMFNFKYLDAVSSVVGGRGRLLPPPELSNFTLWDHLTWHFSLHFCSLGSGLSNVSLFSCIHWCVLFISNSHSPSSQKTLPREKTPKSFDAKLFLWSTGLYSLCHGFLLFNCTQNNHDVCRRDGTIIVCSSFRLIFIIARFHRSLSSTTNTRRRWWRKSRRSPSIHPPHSILHILPSSSQIYRFI